MNITTTEQLRTLYRPPKGRTKLKQLDALEKHSIHFIQQSPFAIIATVNKNGNLDSSPRGGRAGFCKSIDHTTIIIPDSKGNNRLDSLCNIIETGQIGCLFMIPGIDETLRVNGSALISTDQSYLNHFNEEKNSPNCAIKVEIKEVFLHCAKALMRSQLWSDTAKIERQSFPSMGQMINDQLGDTSEPESYESMVKRYQELL